MPLHLIADSGLQFWSTVVEVNPQQPLVLKNGRQLRYTLCRKRDLLTDEITGFDLAVFDPDTSAYYQVGQLTDPSLPQCCELQPDGTIYYDETGMPKILSTAPTSLLTSYTQDSPDLTSLSTLERYRCVIDNQKVNGFDVMLGKWLPMPMFKVNECGHTEASPYAWCRVKIDDEGPGRQNGYRKLRLTWAFDTRTGNKKQGMPHMLPTFYEQQTQAEYRLCDVAEQMLAFLSIANNGFNKFSGYLSSIFGLHDRAENFDYILYYVYLVNYLRLLPEASPEVTLYNPPAESDIPVDLVLDIGNSRTCGVLFERGNFRKALMLKLRDMSHPHRVYKGSFDMRFCFRMANIGLDISLDDEQIFSYGSFVRVGDEARHLLFTSLEESGVAQKLTNYSSPKRYLWDEKPYEGLWENLITSEDTDTMQRLSPYISIPGLSYLFAEDGRYVGNTGEFVMPGTPAHYSRSSLMTFVMIEILQQALMQINSYETRSHWGDYNMRRYLRNIIITCPTAMARQEQLRLRQSAAEAIDAIGKLRPLHKIKIIPEIDKLKVTDRFANTDDRTWIYDEATCCQLVYLYAEARDRYAGHVETLFELKGHVRPEHTDNGNNGKSLTIGTIDIGAGTTDVMVCTYQRGDDNNLRLTPQPLFYDSYFLAGDDILKSLIQNIIIEGKDNGDPLLGSVCSALTARLLAMPESELANIPSVSRFESYRLKIEEILSINSFDIEAKRRKKRELAADMINGFFGTDISAMDYKARRCRVDFNTQISHPMSQFIMEQLRLHRPTHVFTFDELFTEDKPLKYLLDYFEDHFGFRFEELSWRFDPDEVCDIIRSVIETLMKQLSVILHAYHCDIIVLAGRPTSIEAVTELFVKYVPVSPDRLVRMTDYHIGSWFPFADGNGFFYDQKPIVAVGAMVGYLASTQGFQGLSLDLSGLINDMVSTARYIGVYDTENQRVNDAKLTPDTTSATFDLSIFPCTLGCKQLPSPQYQARPLYTVYNNSGRTPLTLQITRDYNDDREKLILEDVSCCGDPIPSNLVELRPQSIANTEVYWLDHGEFKLKIANK